MIVYGVIYKDRCKINPQLPLVFIAIGAIGNFTTFVHALTHNIPQIRYNIFYKSEIPLDCSDNCFIKEIIDKPIR